MKKNRTTKRYLRGKKSYDDIVISQYPNAMPYRKLSTRDQAVWSRTRYPAPKDYGIASIITKQDLIDENRRLKEILTSIGMEVR